MGSERVRLVRKDDSWFIQLLSAFFWCIGRRRKWMERYWVAGLPFTGRTIYVPRLYYEGMDTPLWRAWPAVARAIEHETIHLNQRDAAGHVVYALLYVMSPWHRFAYECEAYQVNIGYEPLAGRASYVRRLAAKLRSFYVVWPRPSLDSMQRQLAAPHSVSLTA